jgi:energy-coupling factor transporter ATP-binding protein EcfA2
MSVLTDNSHPPPGGHRPVNDRVLRVLGRLADVGFQTRGEPIFPFGEPLALVAAVAWDTTTSQLALIADLDENQDLETWRQLLFAGSGIRHQLAGDGPAAYGDPVILAILDRAGERRLRELAEELAENYALFNRIEVNLIRHTDLHNDCALDLALAPLLPSCRRMLGQEISRGEVNRFWQTLRREIHAAAIDLDPVFASHREQAAEDCARMLIGDSAEQPELPAPAPVGQITIENFRTFTNATLELAAVTVVHGPNGSGKSSIIEALELTWAGRSQRQPDDVSPGEYARHLPSDGEGHFTLTMTDRIQETVAEQPACELSRCILSQDAITKLVACAPQERYLQLLAMTGLEVPDLKARTGELIKTTKRDADAALAAAGIPPLRRSNGDARKHLSASLAGGFAARQPTDGQLIAIEAELTAATSTFTPRTWRDEQADAALAALDGHLGRVLTEPETPGLGRALENAEAALRRLASGRQAAAHAARRLLDALRAPVPSTTAKPNPAHASKDPPIPPALALRWVTHARSVTDAATKFQAAAENVTSRRYAEQLAAYASALRTAADTVPSQQLEQLTRSTPQAAIPVARSAIPEEMWSAAGFTAIPENPGRIVLALGELTAELARQAAALHALTRELSEHPARRFAEHSERVLGAICRFELARSLRREGPIMRASETLIGELLQDRLAPVLRELVAATGRFEWYFKPLQIPQGDRTFVLGGLATTRPDLDARMTLNSAERHALGVAWFLTLHLLQPAARRRVLVLDDPTSGFDAVNQAGFVATLRAFVRLTRPEQMILATQDDTLAAVLSEELTPVDGWPQSATRIRCRRDGEDHTATTVFDCPAARRDITEESEILGLHGATAASA